jgi:hypothetical protein
MKKKDNEFTLAAAVWTRLIAAQLSEPEPIGYY